MIWDLIPDFGSRIRIFFNPGSASLGYIQPMKNRGASQCILYDLHNKISRLKVSRGREDVYYVVP
jgi:hypothetical protein